MNPDALRSGFIFGRDNGNPGRALATSRASTVEWREGRPCRSRDTPSLWSHQSKEQADLWVLKAAGTFKESRLSLSARNLGDLSAGNGSVELAS